MAYATPIELLIYRPTIRKDMPEKFLNKMTDEELTEWYDEVREKFLKEGIHESMPIWKVKFEELIKTRSDIYEIFMDKYIWKTI